MLEVSYAITDYKEIEIDVHGEESGCWIDDLDSFYDTDEYKNMNIILKWLHISISQIYRVIRFVTTGLNAKA